MADAELSFRRELLGVDHPVGTVEVTLDRVREYCRLIGENNPLHTDPEAARSRGYRSVLAPTGFVGMYVSARRYPDIQLQFPGVMVKGGQSVEVLQPIQAGDTLAVNVHLKDVYTKTGRSGTMAFVVWELTVTNQDDDLVALAQDHYIYYPRRNEGA